MYLTLLLLYIALMLPFNLGFGITETAETIDRVVDMFFLVDVVLNFRTSYTDRDDVMIMDARKIACNYLKTWFFLDLISSFPFELATAGLMPNLQPAKLLKVGKIMKVFKMLRIGKIKKIFEGNELVDELMDKVFTKSNQVLFKVSKLLVIMLFISHWLACMMGASGQGWTKSSREDVTQIDKYLSAMYWAMTTLTTVGYGDITPFGNVELIYATGAMVVGGSFYGYIVGKISSSISALDLSAQAYYNRMEEVNAWLEYHTELPRSLRRRIRSYFKTSLSMKSAVPDSMIIDDLSPQLVHDVSFFLVQDEIRSNSLFANLPESALSQLMPILVKVTFERGERIVRRGESGLAMFILAEGSARFEQGHQWKAEKSAEKKEKDAENRAHNLQVGDSFGEEIMLGLEETYQYTVIATCRVVAFSIAEQAFSDRFRLMPDVKKSMIANFKKNKEPEKKQVLKAHPVSATIPEGFPETVMAILKDLSRRFYVMERRLNFESPSYIDRKGDDGDEGDYDDDDRPVSDTVSPARNGKGDESDVSV